MWLTGDEGGRFCDGELGGGGRIHRLRHCQPATALTVVMALHHRSVEPQTRQACYGRDQPVNDAEVTDPDRQPVTALTVMMALHPHLINPNHHLPRATQKSQRRFWSRARCHARLCDRLNLRASPLTSHIARVRSHHPSRSPATVMEPADRAGQSGSISKPATAWTSSSVPETGTSRGITPGER